MSSAKKPKKITLKKASTTGAQRRPSSPKAGKSESLTRGVAPRDSQAMMLQQPAATTQFNGTLHRVTTGALTESFLCSPGAADRLLLRNANTLGAQIQAATNYFAANSEGDAISVDGSQIALGTGNGILF